MPSLSVGRPLPLDDVTVRPPGSKSLSNRALLLAAMARGESTLTGLLDADDTRLMVAALRTLGVSIDGELDGTQLRVDGAGRDLGRVADSTRLDCGTAGTVARFLTAALCAAGTPALVDGSARMRERPMAALFDALRSRGARFEFEGSDGALPVRLPRRDTPLRGGRLELGELRSSQFVSALLIAAVWAQAPTELVLTHGTPARPYVDMTIGALRGFGADVEVDADRFVVTPSSLRGQVLAIEPDASAANYFLALAAMWGGRCTIEGLGSGSAQGDARFVEVLERFGARTEQDVSRTSVEGTGRPRAIPDLNLEDMPDMTLTAAVVAAFCRDTTRIHGVGVLRHHESDRIAAAATELRRLGVTVEEHEDGLTITPPSSGVRGGSAGDGEHPRDALRSDVEISTYDDHRMAMAFALVGDVKVREPGCVAKTFPRYFDVLRELGVPITETAPAETTKTDGKG